MRKSSLRQLRKLSLDYHPNHMSGGIENNHLSSELSTGSHSSNNITTNTTTSADNNVAAASGKRRVSIVNSTPIGTDNNTNNMSAHHHLTVPSVTGGGTGGSSGGGGGSGYDNHGFDSPRRRVSLPSEHADIGPVRKKSILHMSTENVHPHHNIDNDNGKHFNGDARLKKSSVTDSIYSKASRTRFSEVEDERSWWYTFCLHCRKKDEIPSWSPPGWSKVCPHPFCPSYRHFARVLALFLIGLLTWGIAYAICGEMAAPGGQLFGLAVLSITAHFGGWLITLTTLPALIGMLVVGIIFQNLHWINLEGEFTEVTVQLRKVALVIILTRAGLELDPSALKRLKFIVMKVGLIPWVVEAGIVALTSHFLLNLEWKWGFLLGSIIAAVSPAVVVPCLFRLRHKGYGVAKGIPTLIIAVSGIDDAASVAIFGIVSSVMFSTDSITYQILQGPLSIIGGIGFGVVWGWMAQYVPEKNDTFVVPLRILMLLGGGMIAIFGSELIHFDGAGPLGCVAAAFVSSMFWSKQGWEIDENPAATAFEIFWMIFEPILFGITGAQIKLDELEPNLVYVGVGILFIGIITRIFVTILVGIGCKLNLKEKVFTAFALMAKATVQAALAPVALHTILSSEKPDENDIDSAQKVMMICILSIILTAPIGAILITLSGPRLLTKTRAPVIPVEGWRRSHRPSIRDISIIDEEEERESPEKIINNIC